MTKTSDRAKHAQQVAQRPWQAVTELEIEAIAQIGMEHAPLEACGILVSGVGIVGIQNRADFPESNTVMKADEILDAMLELGYSKVDPANPVFEAYQDRFSHENLVFWHTHPGGQHGPSDVDLAAKRNQPALRMLVVSIPDGEGVEY